MPLSSTITLSNTLEWARRFTFGRDFAFGNTLEPAMTSANTVMQCMVGALFSWRWNRIVTGFVATLGVQDYTITNRQNNTAVSLKWYIVDSNQNSQQVTAITTGVTGGSIPVWNTNTGGTTVDGGVTWTNVGPILADILISQTYSLAWIETVSIQDLTTQKLYEIQTKINLGLDSVSARLKFISAQGDDGLGDITFRLMPVPDQAYPVIITLQQKPLLFTSTSQTWALIPDEYSHIYNWGLLAMLWMYSDDARFAFANQKFVAQLLSANEGLTETEIAIFLNNWQQVTGAPVQKSDRLVQGVQTRGA